MDLITPRFHQVIVDNLFDYLTNYFWCTNRSCIIKATQFEITVDIMTMTLIIKLLPYKDRNHTLIPQPYVVDIQTRFEHRHRYEYINNNSKYH